MNDALACAEIDAASDISRCLCTTDALLRAHFP